MCRVYSGGSCIWPIPIGSSSETIAASPALHLEWYRTPGYPIYLSEVIRKPFTLSRVFLLFSGGKSVLLVKKKAPSRSGFSASTYVVLKTRYVNPNIHVRRC